MRVLDDICMILEDELEAIVKKGTVSPTELESIYKSVDVMKDIETIKAMKEQGGYSNGYYNSYEDSYMNGRSRRDDRYSGLRGRDSMGRYTSRDGYSRDHETEELREELMNMSKKLDRM